MEYYTYDHFEYFLVLSGDQWSIAGVLHPSVHHLHLYLRIRLQSHQRDRLYSGQCGTEPGKWFTTWSFYTTSFFYF